MALVLATAFSFIPRFFEHIDSTNAYVDSMIARQHGLSFTDRKQVWLEAISVIKSEAWKHTLYLGLKTFGDWMIIQAFAPILFAWLTKIFQYVSTFKKLLQRDIDKSISSVFKQVTFFIKSMGTFRDEFSSNIDRALSPQNVMNKLLGKLNTINIKSAANLIFSSILQVLFTAVSVGFQWLVAIVPVFERELYKYAIQLFGCILYYFESIDGLQKYGVSKLKDAVKQLSM